MVNDVCNLGIIEDAPERRHGVGVYHASGLGTPQSVENDSYMLRRIIFGNDAAAPDWRVRPELPLTIGLMAR